MRMFLRRTRVCAIVGVVAALSGQALAQSAPAPAADSANRAEPIEEITIRGKTLRDYRVEVDEALAQLITVFNEENIGEDNDVTCRNERPTGSRIPQRACRSTAQTRAEAASSRWFLSQLLYNTGNGGMGGTVAAAEATGQAAIAAAESAARVQAELERLARENPKLYGAAVKYIEADDAYKQAREEAER